MSIVNEQILNEINQRNIARAREAAKKMGSLYVLHPSNRVKSKQANRSILDIPRFLLKSSQG